MSHLVYCILLLQLIVTLIQYPCTVALTGLANWSAFLELVFADHVKSQLRQWDPQRALYGKCGSDINPCVSERSFRPSRLVQAYYYVARIGLVDAPKRSYWKV